MEVIEVQQRHLAGTQPAVQLVKGVWVAGGAVRRWFAGESQNSDIDVFATDDDAITAFVEKNGLTTKAKNDRYMTFKASPVQVILQPRFETPEDTIKHFDFTICQFAWDGERVIATPDAIIGVLRKHLAVAAIQPQFEFDSLRRAFKYARAGYWPCIGTMRDLATALRRDDVDLTKQVEMSPGGGHRSTIRWD